MHSKSQMLSHSLGLAAVLAFAGLAALVPGSGAQTPVAGGDDGPHPAHIHIGSCAELGEVVLPLTEVAMPDGEQTGASTAHAIKTSYTVVDAPLEEIINNGHAINVHLSGEEVGTYIACGDIGGVVTTDEDGSSELVIALGELNDSGHVGVAWLGANGDQTEVAVTLIEPEEMN